MTEQNTTDGRLQADLRDQGTREAVTGPEVHITSKTRKPPKAKAKGRKDYRALGVPAEFLNERGGFKGPGWDAKLKSRLIGEALEAEAAKKRTSDAHKLLAKLGWTSHLEKSREARKAKAAKAQTTKPAKEADQAA